ncbi:hypothetical protein ACRFV7_005488 [Klebsiella oxytoca]|nr:MULTISPECIES: hypothetical protein [Klebsiella/Raoultella group]MCF8594645.1 hypothetical protein [Klebsiella sp. FK2020ZBJ35]MCF8600423.1 hypothetical protein [Klebsiella sp. 2019SCSN059]MCJ4910096.1 hypothetical protein [Klebsiella quasipneumoniae]MCJ5551776.1 hypothetical protein [Klebsiella quasipneumoniae]MCJ7295882.1 hypothetical protein [Klebsiella pneumoniae]
MKIELGILLNITYKKVISMFEHNILFNSMMIMIIFLSYMLFKSIKSQKRLHNKYEEVYKAFHLADSQYNGGMKDAYRNLSLSNAHLKFLAEYFNQETVKFDGRNIICEREQDVQYVLSLMADSHFWLNKAMKDINTAVSNTDVIKDIKLSAPPFSSLGGLKLIAGEFNLENNEFDGFATLKIKYEEKKGER